MQSIAQQLAVISSHAETQRKERATQAANEKVKQAKRVATRQKQWASRKAKTTLSAELIARLPSGLDNAISAPEISKLFADFPHAPTGLSSALTVLCGTGQIKRTGECRAYRYYV